MWSMPGMEAIMRKLAFPLTFMALCIISAQNAGASVSDTGNLVVGFLDYSCVPFGGTGEIENFGYSTGSYGSYSPATLTGGPVVIGLYTEWSGAGGPSCPFSSIPFVGWLYITGFTSNPGSDWLVSLTCNGTTVTGSNAGTFGYSQAGEAVWSWNVDITGGLESTSCTITHN